LNALRDHSVICIGDLRERPFAINAMRDQTRRKQQHRSGIFPPIAPSLGRRQACLSRLLVMVILTKATKPVRFVGGFLHTWGKEIYAENRPGIGNCRKIIGFLLCLASVDSCLTIRDVHHCLHNV
jgi:hypothetical protein